jgi:DNA-binding PadR family transcriptional regulator
MTRSGNNLEQYLPLSPPVFHILLALADADLHGYGIMQEVQERTRGVVRLGPGTLYGAIKRLRDDALIEEREDPNATSDERRRCYHLTALGRKLARLEAERLEELVQSAHAKRLLTTARLT